MKKQYQKPEFEIVVLETAEPIAAYLGVASVNPFRPHEPVEYEDEGEEEE